MNLSIIKPFLFTLILSYLFSIKANSQATIKNYEAAWKKVGNFTKKGLPKSALEEVKKIYALAKQDGSTGSPQDAQVIKALVYMTSLQSENREDYRSSGARLHPSANLAKAVNQCR